MFLTRSPLSKVEISDLGRNFALLRVAINPFGAIAEMEEVNGGEKVSLPYRPWNKILQRYRFFSTLSRKLCTSPWVSKGRVGALHTEVDLYAPIVPRMFWGTTLHEIHAEDCTTFPAQHQARRKGWFWCRPKIGSCAPPLRPHPCTLSSPSPSLWSHPHQCWITHNVKKIHQVKDLLDVENPFQFNFCEYFPK